MKFQAIAAMWIMVGTTLSAQETETFPYTATVSSLNATARSGPSFGAYATEKLPKYSQVKVHEHTDSGWIAIAPTREAFDWLPAAVVKREDGATKAKVIEDTECYVGSNLKRVEQHRSGAKLKASDKVHILAEKQVQRTNGESETWFKIQPPPGEFRWVQLKHVSKKSPEQLRSEESNERLAREEKYRQQNAVDPPGLLARALQNDRPIGSGLKKAEPSSENQEKSAEIARAQFLRRGSKPLLPRRSRTSSSTSDTEIPALEIEPGAESPTPLLEDKSTESSPKGRVSLDPEGLPARDKWRPAGSSTPPRETRPIPQLRERMKESPKTAEAADPEMPEEKPKKPAVASRPPLEPEEFKALLARLEVDLTLVVAEDSSKWNLKPLRHRAEALVEDGPTPVHRGHARLMLDRIAEFEATLPAGQRESTPGDINVPYTDALATTKPDFEVQYDAVGYLMPVLGARPGTPPFQLTDSQGHTLQYVSAAPGVNLNRYVKKQVGLYGQRGYLETLKKQHVLAEKVVDLDRHKR